MAEKVTHTCHLCEANCGLIIDFEGRKALRITGDHENPLSRGYICPKATALIDVQNAPDRLRRPMKRIGDRWAEIDWDLAFSEIAERIGAIDRTRGVVTAYIGNPAAHNYSALTQIPLLKSALGMPATYSAATIDNMPNMVVQLMMYGHDFLYPVPDVDRTQFMLIVGANPVASNGSLWTAPGVREKLNEQRAQK